MSNPQVSVIVATDRGGPYLREALASVAAQDYPDVECILVDDGSPDPDAIRAVTDEFPFVQVVRQSNTGSSIARNNGVIRSTGEYLVFLDDDDRWRPDRLSAQVAAMEDAPDAAFCYCRMDIIDENGDPLPAPGQVRVADFHDVLRRKTGIILPNVMIRRRTFLRIGGFHPAFRRAQDLDLVLKAALEGDVVFVDRALVDYRTHPGNNTRRHRELCRSIDEIVRLHRWAAMEKGRDDLVADHDVSLRANKRYAAWSALRAAKRLSAEHAYGRAASELVWAVRFAPLAPLDAIGRRVRGQRPAG